jgi:hypothetical protein
MGETGWKVEEHASPVGKYISQVKGPELNKSKVVCR